MVTFSFVSYNLLMVDTKFGEGTVPSVSVFTTCNCVSNHDETHTIQARITRKQKTRPEL